MRRISLPLAAWTLVLALGASGCSLLGFGTSTYEVQAEFTRAFNLFPGSEVRLLGVEVGTVTDVEVPVGADTAIATLQVSDKYELPQDVRASIIQGALLGERYVQLDPPYEGGPQLEGGETIPVARTDEPAEFDELLESLNDILDKIPPEELARLVRNAADVLEGRGEELGQTFEEVAGLVDALQEVDQDLVDLTGRLADLSGTLSTRDAAIGAAIEDYSALFETLADERQLIDSAIGETARMVSEVRSFVDDHAGHLDEDVEATTRVLRTVDRNLSEVERVYTWQSELYRHARRVFDRERNWLPLVNHDQGLQRTFEDRLGERLADLCGRLDITECADPGFWDGQFGSQELCMPGFLACADGPDGGDAPVPLDEALRQSFEVVPELPDRILEESLRQRPTGPDLHVGGSGINDSDGPLLDAAREALR